jgi:pentatricopeptide repeat protein
MHWKGFRGSLKAFTALMDAYSRAGDVDSVQAVFDSLRFAKLQPDDWALAILVGAYRKANMLGTAMQVLADLESARIKPGPLTLRSLAGEFGKI